MKVNIFNQTNEDIKTYEKVLKKVFNDIEDVKNMNVVFVTLDEIKRLNRTYRNINRPTDVLSFINEDDPESNGDIFISIDKVKAQAKDYGHSEKREVSFLAVHGYLHLKGYDHKTEQEEKEMMNLTEKILKKAKLGRD